MTNRDLTAFDDDNARWRSQRRRVPWQERAEMIYEHFPKVRNPDWNVLLRDDEIFGRLVQDILKVDQITPGRAGPRPHVNNERGWQLWKEMSGQDFAQVAFASAFRILVGKDSIRIVARKTAISKSRVERLLKGQDPPTVEDIRAIAAAYKKRPAYFAEYRIELILSAIYARLEEERELTVTIYKKLVRP